MSIDERMQVVSCDIKHLYSVRSFLERIGRSPLFSKEALQQSELQQENIIAENTANPALENDPFDWSSQHYVEPVLYRSYQEAEAEFNASSQSTCIHVRSYGLNSAPPPERSLDELTTSRNDDLGQIPRNILVLGLPSLHGIPDDTAFRQHVRVLMLVNRYFNHLLEEKGSVGTVYFDYTFFTKQDMDFLLLMYKERFEVQFLPLAEIVARLREPDRVNNFVMTFSSKNPIRQIIADTIIEQRSIPGAIICAPPELDIRVRDGSAAGDRTSLPVHQVLGSGYNPVKFTSAEEGETTNLYLAKYFGTPVVPDATS